MGCVIWKNSLSRVVLTAPWARETWQATAHVLTGAPIAVGGLAVLLLLASPAMLVLTIPPALAMVFPFSRKLAALQSMRFREFLGETIFPAPDDYPEGFWNRLSAEAADRHTWRRVGFHLMACVTELAAALALALLWSAAFALTLLPVLALVAGDMIPQHSIREFDFGYGTILKVYFVLGLGLLFSVPWAARGLAALDLAAARKLLGRDRTEELSYRVEALTESRSAVVDAADAERRRIERDLHDGTQQRLVALAMNLGMIKAMHPELPEIAEAHEEAKLTLAELRDFVRGLHPAVLNDRGLDAALSGIAARSPVPVRLNVDLKERPSATTEAIAYFVVSESLANAAKHAQASFAEVDVTCDGGLIRVVITDDGIGGAHPGKGSGLRGLAQRVESVDGTLSVHSPVGGPTTIISELPCAS